MKHTEGLWMVHPQWPHIVIPANHAERAIGGADTPEHEAEKYAKQIHEDWAAMPPYKYDRAAYHRTRTQHEESLANACLIAAAPELLEACGVVASAIRNLEGQPIQYSLALDLAAALSKVDAALRKAEGQP